MIPILLKHDLITISNYERVVSFEKVKILKLLFDKFHSNYFKIYIHYYTKKISMIKFLFEKNYQFSIEEIENIFYGEKLVFKTEEQKEIYLLLLENNFLKKNKFPSKKVLYCTARTETIPNETKPLYIEKLKLFANYNLFPNLDSSSFSHVSKDAKKFYISIGKNPRNYCLLS